VPADGVDFDPETAIVAAGSAAGALRRVAAVGRGALRRLRIQ